MRQSTRGVQYTPKATYTDFSKGMEYTAHAKDNNNPRAQLIKNMEIAPDGRLKVRRPLVPVLRNNGINSGLSAIPEGHIKLKTFYAPFRGLEYPYITFIWNPTTSSTYMNYIINGQQIAFSTTLMNDLVVTEFGAQLGLERELEGVFIPGQNILTLNAFNGILNLSFDSANNSWELTRPEIHTATLQETVDYGINLYGKNPLFIPNVITSEQLDTVSIQAIIPYKLLDSAKALDANNRQPSPENWVYDSQPQGTDQIMLKPNLAVPTTWLSFEINTFLDVASTVVAGKTLYSWKWKSGVEAKLKTGLGKTSGSNPLTGLSPTWVWHSKPLTEGAGASRIQPATGNNMYMPVFFTFMYGGSDMATFETFAKNELSRSGLDLTKVEFTNSIEQLVSALLVGNTMSWRADLYKITNAFDVRLYKLEIDFGAAFVTLLEETTFAAGTTTGSIGVKNISVYSEIPSSKNVFSDLFSNSAADVMSALNPKPDLNSNKKVLIATPSTYVNGFAMGVELGDATTVGMRDVYGFVLYMPETKPSGSSKINAYPLINKSPFLTTSRDIPRVSQNDRYYFPGINDANSWREKNNNHFKAVYLNTYTEKWDAGNVKTEIDGSNSWFNII